MGTSAIALREGAGLRTGEDRDTVIKAQRDHMSANRHWLMQDLYGGGLLGAEDSGGYRKLKVVRESAPFEKMIDEAEADDKNPQPMQGSPECRWCFGPVCQCQEEDYSSSPLPRARGPSTDGRLLSESMPDPGSLPPLCQWLFC